jgi:uncharacterized delta-60 repeat protein
MLVIMLLSRAVMEARPGDLDLTFRVDPMLNGEEICCIAMQSDGKILVGGDIFYTVDIEGRSQQLHGVARLEPDGSWDASFVPLTEEVQIPEDVYALAIEPSGSVLVGGWQESECARCRALVRLHHDGSRDVGFDPQFSAEDESVEIRCLRLQPDGRILVGGHFTRINGVTRQGIARLDPDGTVDLSFHPEPGLNLDEYHDATVYSMALQADGRVVLGGKFGKVNGQSRDGLARLNSDGSLDNAFNPSAQLFDGFSFGQVASVLLQRDGKVLVVGSFTLMDAQRRSYHHLVRLNTGGVIDTSYNSFAPPNMFINTPFDFYTEVLSLAQQADMKFIVGGRFKGMQNLLDVEQENIVWRTNVARFNLDGSLDLNFNCAAQMCDSDHMTQYVKAIAIQSDGRILLGGRFNARCAESDVNLVRLVGTAVKPDTNSPTLKINSPTNNARVTTRSLTVRGTAIDDVAVAQVWCQLNGNAWQIAEGTSQWSHSFQLESGANIVRAYAVDTAGNRSNTNSLQVMFISDELSTSSFDGYYIGDGRIGNLASFQFCVMVSANCDALGIIFESQKKGATFQEFSVGSDGHFSYYSTAWEGSMTGQITSDGKIVAHSQHPLGNGQFTGARQPFSGPLQNDAGLYLGTYNYAGLDGEFRAILCPDGTLFYWYGDESYKGVGDRTRITDPAGNFSFMVPTQHQVEGLLDRTQFTITGRSASGFGIITERNCTVIPPGNPPRITQQPTPQQRVVSGGTGTFKVIAQGLLPLSYQWYHMDVALANATNATLILRNLKLDQSGAYMVEIRNIKGAVRSNPAQLEITPETVKPSVAISSPANQARVFDPQVNLRGNASDNVWVAQVQYQLGTNMNPWQAAVGTTQWAASLFLQPGQNIIQVRAVDSSGNVSQIKSCALFYVVKQPLSLIIQGCGKVTGVTNGQLLELGKSYLVSAVPFSDCLFKTWLIDGAPNAGNPLSFVMKSNLTLQAQFESNPFPALKGTYTGLFYPTNNAIRVTPTNAGSVTLTLTDKGLASGKLNLAGQTISLSSMQFDLNLAAHASVKRKAPLLPLDIFIQLATNGLMRGQVAQGQATSDLTAVLMRPQTNWIGHYTFVLTGGDIEDTSAPPGASVGTINVSKSGEVKWTCNLSDGAKLSGASVLSAQGWWPCFASMQNGQGLLLGWGIFNSNVPSYAISGDFIWSKGAAPTKTDPYYPAGFLVQRRLQGARYLSPAKGKPVMEWTLGNLEFEGGDLDLPVVIPVRWTNNSLVVVGPNINKLTGLFTASSGTVTGTFVPPGANRTLKYCVALLPPTGWAAGWFLGPTLGGLVDLHAQEQP